MKINVHIGLLLFGAFFLMLITYFVTEKYNEPTQPVTIKRKKDFDIVTFKLPNSIDSEIKLTITTYPCFSNKDAIYPIFIL